MRKFTALLAAGLVLGASGMAMAAGVTANASASIINPITLSETTPLAFGAIAPTASAGTVAITAEAASTKTPTNVEVRTTGHAAGKFTVGGETGVTYAITVPASVSLTGGGDPMTVTLIKDKATGTITGGTAYTTPGTDVFYVGGSLAVGASQLAGSYTGTYSVTVAYN